MVVCVGRREGVCVCTEQKVEAGGLNDNKLIFSTTTQLGEACHLVMSLWSRKWNVFIHLTNHTTHNNIEHVIEDEVLNLVIEYDVNGDGTIDFDEFMEMMKKQAEHQVNITKLESNSSTK